MAELGWEKLAETMWNLQKEVTALGTRSLRGLETLGGTLGHKRHEDHVTLKKTRANSYAVLPMYQAMLSALYTIYLILVTALKSRNFCYPHFTE